GDWQWFAEQKAQQTDLLSFLANRYETWTSRLLMEMATWWLADNLGLFVVLTLFWAGMLLYSLLDILRLEKANHRLLLTAAVCLLIPFSIHYSAGFFATTINYLWPVAAALFVISVMFRIARKQRVSIARYVAASSALSFAIFSEQAAVVLLTSSVPLLIYIIRQKKLSAKRLVFPISTIIFSLGGIINTLLCPGNRIRGVEAVQGFFAGYFDISLFHKLDIVFCKMFYDIFLQPMTIVVLLCALLVYIACKQKNLVAVWLAGIPLVVSGLRLLNELNIVTNEGMGGWNGLSNPDLIFNLFSKMDYLRDYVLVSYVPKTLIREPLTFVPELVALAIVGCLVASIVLIVKDKCLKAAYLSALTVAVISYGIMAFTPTIYVSATRPYLFFYVIVVAVLVSLFINRQEIIKKSGKIKL
ncbi:MAG: hypothetical protein LBU20_02175, partial [Candidatus Nomurabacteria bacterium]|nr:hypothetical protein [Candidatus Nomurabacteria bacterium]